MTTKELKKYLEDFRDERQSVKHWIESLQYHYDHIKPYKDCYAVKKGNVYHSGTYQDGN